MRLSKTLRWTIVVSGVFFTIGLAVATWRYLSSPTLLNVAVGPPGFEDAALMAAFGRALTSEHAAVRLSVTTSSGPVEALDRLSKRGVQLAVIRSDGGASDRLRAIAILHSDPVVVVTPENAKTENFGELKGKTIGVIGPPGANDVLLATLRRHYRAPGETLALPPAQGTIATALRDRKVDALLFVAPSTRGATIGESWAAVRGASRRKLAFVELEDAETIAAATPAYESGEIAAGQFGGSPALPRESISTLQVATYLVADREISNDVITRLTRNLFEQRQRIAAEVPAANLIKAASTDKDAVFPVHPGAKAYYDGEETMLFERYGDLIFYGSMLLGALSSALLAIMRFLGLRSEAEDLPLLSRFAEVIEATRRARSIAELEAIGARADAAVERLASEAAAGDVDAGRTGVIALAVQHLDVLLAERRQELLNQDSRHILTGRKTNASA